MVGRERGNCMWSVVEGIVGGKGNCMWSVVEGMVGGIER